MQLPLPGVLSLHLQLLLLSLKFQRLPDCKESPVLFHLAAVNQHKRSDIKTTEIHLRVLEVKLPERGLTEPKSRRCSVWRFLGKIHFLPALRGHSTFLACVFFPLQSQQQLVKSFSSCLSLTDLPRLSFIWRDPCDYPEPTDNPDNLSPQDPSLNCICKAPFCPGKAHICTFQELECMGLWGPKFWLPHSSFPTHHLCP